MTNTMTAAEYRTATRNSRNRKAGAAAETLTRYELQRLGVCRVRKLEVGWGIVRNRAGKIVSAYPLERIDGDFSGILPDGTAVLVETKKRSDKLVYSALENHQVQALNDHAEHNGLSLLVWVSDDDVYVMRWPIDGFESGTSLDAEQAQAAAWEGVA